MNVPCPHCGRAIRPGSLLAALTRGKPKVYSQAEIAIRTARLAEARKRRWASRPTVPPPVPPEPDMEDQADAEDGDLSR